MQCTSECKARKQSSSIILPNFIGKGFTQTLFGEFEALSCYHGDNGANKLNKGK